MKLFILTVSFMICSAIPGYTQNGGSVVKKDLERNKSIKTKGEYNYFLLGAIEDSDAVYIEYEDLIQKVWDKKLNVDLAGTSKEPLRKLTEIQQMVEEMPVYKGGNHYQKTVINYLEAVKKKVELLERYGILGADPNSDIQEYNNMVIAFNDISNEAIDKRNIVRREKKEYEKTIYIE